MNKKQTLKRVATAVITANVLASTFITSLPAKSFAAENQGTEVGNRAETRLMGALQNTQNLLQNTQFNGLTGWSVDSYGTQTAPYSTVVGNNDGSVTMTQTTTSRPVLKQNVSVVAGHTYQIKMAFTNVQNAMFGAEFDGADIDANFASSANISDWRYTPTYGDFTYNYTATTTRNANLIMYVGRYAGTTPAIGKFSNFTIRDITTIDQTVINSITSSDTVVKGKGEAGASVVIKNGSTQIGTGTVDANGNYSITIPKQDFGSVITATVSAYGLTSSANTTVTQAPIATPTIAAMTSKSTTASGTGEPGATLTFKANGVNYSTTVASDGKWSVTIPKQAANTVVEATSVLNGVSSAKATATVAYEGPNTPILNNVTNRSTKVTGTGDPGNTVTIKVKTGDDSISYIGTIDDFGEFSINIDTPEAGATVEAIAKDSSNTLSQKASTTVLDVIAPDAPTVQAVKDTDTKVTGSGEANCDVTVTLPSGGIIEGRTDADGKFSINIPKQTAGRDIKVNLTDAAGNVGAATTVTVQTDVLANPTVNRISNQDTKATGTGVAGATITLTANDHDYTAEVGADGKYEVTIPKLAAGLSVVVKQAKNGRTSGSVNTIVQDDRTPAKPVVNPVKDSDTQATGTGTAGDTIKVTLPNGDVATGVVAADGTWTVTIPAQAAGSELDVTATGPNGRTSDATEVTVAQTPQTGTLTTNDFTMGRDQYIVGSYTGDVKKFRVTIGDKVYEGGSLDTVRKTYTFYAVDKAVEGNFTIAALDKYGNVLDTKTAKMIRQSTRTPVAPVVNPVKDIDTKATGTGVAGDTITVKLPNGDTKTGVVAADGTWSITIPAQAAGAKIDVTATTPDNKVSPATTVTIGQTTQVGAITTANDFTVGTDKYITGNFTGAIKSLRVTIGTNVYTGGTLDTTAGTFSFYALATATAAGTYKIEGLDKYGNVISTKTANIIKNSGNTGVGTGTVSANGFVIHTDKNVTGTITGDVKTLRLVYDGVTYTGGTIAADKTFTFYALDKILNKSKSARIDGYDANGNKIATSTITLSDSQDNNSGVGSGTVTADDFNVGTDRNITGKYTGDVKSIKVRVGDVTYSGGTLTDGNFTFYASDKITSTTQVVFVDGYDANGNRIATSAVSTAVILPATSGTITPATYKIPADRTLTATYTGDVKTVKVTINGTVYTGGTVSGGNVSFYIGDKITSTSDIVKITALDAYGRTLQTKDVTIQSSVVIPNVVTPATFTIGTSYLTGTYSGNVKTVKVKINDVVYSGGTVEDGRISFYIGNKVTSVSDSVIIYGYDANGTQVDMKTVTVARPAVGTGTVTPATFTTPGSTNLTGTYTGDVKTIVVNINGTDYTGGTVADGAFTFWIGTKITSVDDVVKVKGLDANQNVIDTKTVTIAAAQPDEGTITPATFSLRTSSITGAYTGPGKSLRVTVNGVALPVGGAVANNNFSYYVGIKNKVTSTSDVVKIALLDKNGLVMEEKPVTIVD